MALVAGQVAALSLACSEFCLWGVSMYVIIAGPSMKI